MTRVFRLPHKWSVLSYGYDLSYFRHVWEGNKNKVPARWSPRAEPTPGWDCCHWPGRGIGHLWRHKGRLSGTTCFVRLFERVVNLCWTFEFELKTVLSGLQPSHATCCMWPDKLLASYLPDITQFSFPLVFPTVFCCNVDKKYSTQLCFVLTLRIKG